MEEGLRIVAMMGHTAGFCLQDWLSRPAGPKAEATL